MRRKDKVIKEALQIYQQEKKETLPVYQEEERDSFEDRIYEKIRKMDIPNPRRKAHMVSLAIMVVFVVAIGIFFMQYRNKNRVSNTTKMIEKLYQEGSTDGSKYGIDVLRGTIRQEKKEYIYLIRYLSSTQKNALRKAAYKKTYIHWNKNRVAKQERQLYAMRVHLIITKKKRHGRYISCQTVRVIAIIY